MKNKRWIILIIIGMLLIPFNLFVPDASASWWDTDWSYYKTLEVADKIEGYQMKLLVDFDADVGGNISCDGHCQADFDDLRFVYNNVTELPYWIENYTVSSQATFWVNNSGNYSSFEMFYGNAGVGNNSNGDNTFYFYADMEENDLTDWDTVLGNTAVSSDQSYTGTYSVKTPSKASVPYSEAWETISSLNDGYAYCIFLYDQGNTEALFLELLRIFDGANNIGIGIFTSTTTTKYIYHTTGYGYTATAIDRSNGWHLLEARVLSDIDLVIDGAVVSTEAGLVETSLVKYGITSYKGTASGYFDDAFVRKYASTEPSWSSFGSEQEYMWSPYLSNEHPSDGAVDVEVTPSLYVTCTDNNSNTMNATWRSNSSGNWVSFAVNNSINTGTIIYQNNTNFSVLGTTYWWSVNISDGTGLWGNETYHFTIIDNFAPTLSDEDPDDGSITVAIDTDLSITIEDIEGDSFNYSWSCSDGSSGSVNEESNGSKMLVLDGDLLLCTLYTWWVNATDGNSSINESYSFTTYCPTVPADGYVLAWNETLTQLCVDLVDSDGDGMEYTISQNDVVLESGGTFVYTNTTVNFTDTTNNTAHWESSKGRITSGAAFTGTTEFTSGEYQNISSVNGSGISTADCAPPIWSHHNFSFDLSNYVIHNITGLEVRWHGYGAYYTGGAKPKWNWGTTMYFEGSGVSWYTADSTTPFTTDDFTPVEEWINYSAHHEMEDWINDNNVLNVAVEHTGALDCSVIYTDYIELIVTTISGGVGNGTYCTSNVSWWNDTCDTVWSWVVYVNDGRGESSTTTYTFYNAPCTYSGSVYPTSASVGICPCSDSICVVVTVGYNFNMTIYGRSSYEVNYTVWDKYVNISADEYCFCLCGYIIDGWHQPMRYNTTYSWYVNVSKFDNSSMFNQTSVYNFTTATNHSDCLSGSTSECGGGGGMMSTSSWVVGLIGLFGLLGYFMHRRRKKNE